MSNKLHLNDELHTATNEAKLRRFGAEGKDNTSIMGQTDRVGK